MAYVITAPEYLEIDDVPLSTPAWETTAMDDLWSGPAVRGEDILVPLGDGVRAEPRRPTVTPVTVELAIVGDLAPDGTPNADVRHGLWTNCLALLALTTRTGTATDGTRHAVLHLPPGADPATREGRVHVLRLRLVRNGPMFARGQLDLSLPAGALV